MKKLTLCCLIAVFTALFTSCDKNACYECTRSSTINGTTTTHDICSDQVTSTTIRNAYPLKITTPLNGASVEDYKTILETNGYTCTQK